MNTKMGLSRLLLVLEVLIFLFPDFMFCYNFILTSKDICTAFNYCCVSVGLGIITVVMET